MANPAANVAANVAAELQAFRNCLTQVLNFTPNQVNTLIVDGFETASDVVGWSHKEVKDWCQAKTKLAINRGGCNYGELRVRNLQGLVWWCNDRHLRGKDLDLANEFNAAALLVARDEAKLDYEESKQDAIVDKPGKFDTKKWHDWSEALENYLSSIKNIKGIPMSYVIREDPPTIPAAQMDREQEIIYNASLTDSMFKRDNKHIEQLLKELIVGTDAEHWARGKKGARDIMIALREHYDGKAEGERQKAIANADLGKLFYRNESTFPFEKFVTKLKEGFDILEKYSVPVHEENKLRMLFEKMQCNNAEFKSEVILCRATHTVFTDATIYLQTAVTRIFPNFQPSSGRYNRRRNINASGRGRGRGRGRGAGRGRGGRGHGKKPSGTMENGVDISDVTRWYSQKEFDKLSHDTRSYILNHPDRATAVEARKKQKVSATSTERSTTDEEQNRMVSATITGTMRALSQRGQQMAAQPRYSLNGNRSISGAGQANRSQPPSNISTPTNADTGDDMSRVTYDHLGNITNN